MIWRWAWILGWGSIGVGTGEREWLAGDYASRKERVIGNMGRSGGGTGKGERRSLEGASENIRKNEEECRKARGGFRTER